MGRKVTIGAYQAGALSGFDALLNLEGFFDELGVIATDQIVYTSLLQAGIKHLELDDHLFDRVRSEYLRKKISRIRGVGVSHPRSVIRALFRSVATGTDKSKNDLDRIAAFSETWSMQTNGAPTWF